MGWLWDLVGIYVAPLISWAQGYEENGDKEKDTADLNRNAKPGRECLQTLPSSYRLLFFFFFGY